LFLQVMRKRAEADWVKLNPTSDIQGSREKAKPRSPTLGREKLPALSVGDRPRDVSGRRRGEKVRPPCWVAPWQSANLGGCVHPCCPAEVPHQRTLEVPYSAAAAFSIPHMLALATPLKRRCFIPDGIQTLVSIPRKEDPHTNTVDSPQIGHPPYPDKREVSCAFGLVSQAECALFCGNIL
jgi:hypothetical protein